MKQRPEVVQAASDECRRALGDERFEALAAEVEGPVEGRSAVVALPRSVDRAAVYRAIAAGAWTLQGRDALRPEMVHDRDKAVSAVSRALVKLRRALKRTPWAASIGGLEREWSRLTEGELLSDGRRCVPVLRLDPKSWGWPRALAGRAPGGRTPGTWRTETEAALRALGVKDEKTDACLRAAGLIGKDPGPERERLKAARQRQEAERRLSKPKPAATKRARSAPARRRASKR